MFNFQRFIVILCIALVAACGGKTAVKKEAGTQASRQTGSQTTSGKGGYYLDDGPGDDAHDHVQSRLSRATARQGLPDLAQEAALSTNGDA